ncbi:hypothetical protein [Microvirga sp. G4-2]|uniref:hypothetical protein n=1 Tax=Microvirga sp. G4-2 TaxID=3434467 RepID=UPI004044EDA1
MPADHVSFHAHAMGMAQLLERLKARQATIGMGDVGLPLAPTVAKLASMSWDLSGACR